MIAIVTFTVVAAYEFNGLIDRYDTSGNFLGQFGSVSGARGNAMAIVPEPSTLTLAAFGLLGLAYDRRKQR